MADFQVVVARNHTPLTPTMNDYPLRYRPAPPTSSASTPSSIVSPGPSPQQSGPVFVGNCKRPIQRGVELRDLGLYEDALAHFVAALRHEPLAPTLAADVLMEIGFLHRRHHNHVQALHAFSLAAYIRRCALGPDHCSVASALYHMALANIELEECEAAKDDLIEAVSILQSSCDISEDVGAVWMALGRVLVQLGEMDEATSTFQEVASHIWKPRSVSDVHDRLETLFENIGNHLSDPRELNAAVDQLFESCVKDDELEIQPSRMATA